MFSSEKSVDQQPLYTREILNNIEAELANDGVFITLQRSSGNSIGSFNMCRGGKVGASGLGPLKKRTGNIVAFHDERTFQKLKSEGRLEQYFPVVNVTTTFKGPNQTEEETRKMFEEFLFRFEASDEGIAIANLIKTELKGRAINKVIAFGMGCIGIVDQGPFQSYYEHAAALVVAKAAGEVSSCPNVTLLVQDPLYTDVCKKVLREFGFGVIEGFGAKGFALVDDSTIVLAHNPEFPVREIIADIARPALICMKKEEPANATGIVLPLPDDRADVDSVRSRKMLQEYRSVSLPGAASAFWENTWYIRESSLRTKIKALKI
ncbi:hypothetical protein F5Y09DRAFT_357428 [Xylaria sp. FL1042]|nr:hypothetical protein F5Y09DRAFT_357428 [Xylaria sp. FL1042]